MIPISNMRRISYRYSGEILREILIAIASADTTGWQICLPEDMYIVPLPQVDTHSFRYHCCYWCMGTTIPTLLDRKTDELGRTLKHITREEERRKKERKER
jgi:hypothetical protein